MGAFHDDFSRLLAKESSTVIVYSLHDQSFQIGARFWILMSILCRQSLSHSRRLLVSSHMLQRYRSSSRFLLHPGDASHLYPCHCFFQMGGTSFRGCGLASSSEHFSLLGTLLLGGGDYLVSSFSSLGEMISFFKSSSLSYSLLYISLFLEEGFSHVVFPLSPLL